MLSRWLRRFLPIDIDVKYWCDYFFLMCKYFIDVLFQLRHWLSHSPDFLSPDYFLWWFHFGYSSMPAAFSIISFSITLSLIFIFLSIRAIDIVSIFGVRSSLLRFLWWLMCFSSIFRYFRWFSSLMMRCSFQRLFLFSFLFRFFSLAVVDVADCQGHYASQHFVDYASLFHLIFSSFPFFSTFLFALLSFLLRPGLYSLLHYFLSAVLRWLRNIASFDIFRFLRFKIFFSSIIFVFETFLLHIFQGYYFLHFL